MAKLEHQFDPFELFPDIKVRRDKRRAALDDIADFLGEQVLSDVGSARSPVSGRAFQGLSKAYKKRKAGESSSPIANLELTGDMLDHFETRVAGNRVQSGVYGPTKTVAKARGHNQHPGDEHEFLPVRQFVPRPGENYRKGIRDGIKQILRRHSER